MANNPKNQELNSQLGNIKRSDKFQALLDCAGVMFIEMDTRGVVTLVNKKTCEVFGYSESEMLGKKWFENFLPERIREKVLPISKKLLSGEIESTEFYENPILTKNKEEKIIYWHNTLIKDANGKVVGHLSSGEDITKQKRTEELIKNNEEKFRTIVDYTHDWEYWIGINNEFLYISPSCSRITGYEPEDFYKDKLLLHKIIYPDDLDAFLHHKHSIDKNGFRTSIDFRIITRSNEIQWIGHVCQNVYDSNGRPKGIRGSNRLITQQKENEQHRKMLSNIVEQSSSSIAVTNLNGDIEYVNSSFTNITGYSFKEVIGQNPRILNSGKNNPQIFTDLWNTITQGKVWEGEFINNRKNGELYYEKAIISPTFNEKGEIVNYFAIKEDITERKRAEQRLQESEHNLKVANATKDKFFSIIAHDLSSPFNAIIGFSNLLLENQAEYGVKQREDIIKLISESSKSTLDLLENLLKWARTQTGGIKFNPNLFILEEIILVTFEQVKEIALQKNIQLAYNVDNKIIVNADEAMLETVLRNLLSNAIKFTPKNGNIEVIATEKDESITVSVKDNGIGIKKEQLKTLFTSLDNETTRGTENEKGHGLGLILCKEFIEKHGGKIFVKSEEGAGSTFSFIIPSGVQKAELN